MAECIAFQCRL